MTEPATDLPTASPSRVVPFPGTVAAADAPVLLVGNPNVGKSVLFKNLTGRYVMVSNFPGTTVEIARARGTLGGRAVDVVDTPGVNDLTPSSDEAQVTRRLLARHAGATVVQVADAKNLRRALLLTLQLAELGHPMVLVLNMLDELTARGGHIDVDALSALLGIPVVPAVAIRGLGTPEIAAAVAEAARPRLPS
ncbi:MAG TPA: FeoB small GTPase domain-containing protein, partial [Thermoanaerobaculia bacterium]|nr:FeoB small GTPase domain-containing protein [Thermoanaerobaculia bacterium]